jgi:hypothetical protein
MESNKLSVVLYGGEVKIDFFPESHRYKKPTERTYLISATSATGVIDKSRFLIPWAVGLDQKFLLAYLEKVKGPFSKEELFPIIDEAFKQHTVKKEEAADIGSKVHDWIERFVKAKMSKTESPSIDDINDDNVLNGINGFLDWYNGHKIEFTGSERLIYSKEYDYCGIADFTAIVDGKNWDFKTSKAVYPEHQYQLSAYWKAIEEEDNKLFDCGIILHVDKESGEFHSHKVSKEENLLNFPVFLSCLTIKQREKQLSKY